MKHLRTETKHCIKNADGMTADWPSAQFPTVSALKTLGISFYVNEPVTLVTCQVDIYEDTSHVFGGRDVPKTVLRFDYRDYRNIETHVLRKQRGELILK